MGKEEIQVNSIFLLFPKNAYSRSFKDQEENLFEKHCEKMQVTKVFSFSHNICYTVSNIFCLLYHFHPFPKRQILDSLNLKEFADDNFRYNENGRKFSKRVGNTVGKGENFPTVFSKDFYCRNVKKRVCLGKGSYYVCKFLQFGPVQLIVFLLKKSYQRGEE